MRTLLTALAVVAILTGPTPVRAEPLRIFTTPAFGQALAGIAPAMRTSGIDFVVRGEAASSAAVQLLATGEADAVFTVRPISGEDRAIAPEKHFTEYPIATQAVALLVSRDVWEAGVRALSREQVRRIYEREVTNWKDLGGADRAIRFFNSQQGHGVWEQFAQWIYGEIRRAPLGKFDTVVTGEDAHNAIEFNGGSMSIAAPRWSDGREVFAIALSADGAAPIAPSREHFADGSYPLARPVLVAFGDKPTGAHRRLLDFLLAEKCQQLLFKAGLVPVMESAEKK